MYMQGSIQKGVGEASPQTLRFSPETGSFPVYSVSRKFHDYIVNYM